MAFSAARLATLATTPRDGDRPAGDPIVGYGRLDDLVFAKLFNTFTPDPESVDWSAVLEEGTDLLERSRDLRYARWVSHALIETQGLAGLELGLKLLLELITTFGGDLLPADPGKRSKELSGFDEFASTALARLGRQGGADPRKLLSDLRTLDGALKEAPGAALPELRKIGEWISSTFPEAVQEPEPQAPSAPEEQEPPAADERGPAESAEAPPAGAATAPAARPTPRFHDLGCTPISDDTPAGARLTDWGELATEYFQKLSSPTAAGQIQWPLVRDAGLRLLQQSKDLRAALVAVNALMRTEGLKGLADGVELISLLAGTFGRSLHPPDPGDRLKKLSEFDEEASAWLSEQRGRIGTDAIEFVTALDTAIRESRETLQPVVEDLAWPRLGRGVAGLKDDLERPAPEPAAAPPASTAPAAPVAPVAPAAPAAPVEAPSGIDSPARANKALADAQTLLRAVAGFFRENKPDDPLSRRLERQALWIRVMTVPKDGVVRGPSKKTVDELTAGISSGATSLADLEKICRERIFWLTGQRLIHDVLRAQGDTAGAASVRAETAALVAAFPGIENAKLEDGQAVADEETLGWLASARGGGARLPPSSGAVTESRKEMESEARRLAGGGKLSEAVALYQAEWRACGSARETFQLKFELARLCIEQNAQFARSLLEELEETIAAHDVGVWEPEMAIALYSEQLALCPKQDVERRAELFGKLVRVDPGMAASIE